VWENIWLLKFSPWQGIYRNLYPRLIANYSVDELEDHNVLFLLNEPSGQAIRSQPLPSDYMAYMWKLLSF
ncbi:MAG: hypothetical protein C4519_14495, partial [Desulfobacteraceae bacterium]